MAPRVAVILFLTLLLSACAFREVTGVTVWDHHYTQLRTVREPALVDEFSRMWRDREEADIGWEGEGEGLAAREGHYLLDIATSRRAGGGRWIYDPQGYMVYSDIKLAPVYRIPNHERMNELLGIEE